MSFTFTHRENLKAQVRAIAREQIEKALEEADGSQGDLKDIVHSLRRRCKKLRGLVKLVGPHLDGAGRENAAFRDAAASLSHARDGAVMAETFSSLLEFDREHGRAMIGKSEAEAIANGLEQQMRQSQTGEADPFSAFRAIFLKAHKRVKRWELDRRGFDVIGDGLVENYQQFRQRMAAAQDKAVPERLHEWRKAARYHEHHVSLVRHSAPELLKGRQKAVGKLGDFLGDHHNLAMLADALAKFYIKGSAADVIVARQDELAASAFGVGRQLASEKPEALRQRFKAYWSLLPEKT